MTNVNDTSAGYVLGHSGRELARLEQQAAFFADATRELLLRAGLKPGMRVLDVGCGVGDVAAIAADIVGSGGEVTGIDISAGAIAIADARMKATGRDRVRFLEASMESFDELSGFDAVVGRFILVHMPDPATLLRALVPRLDPGTMVAFIEMDMSTGACVPPSPLLAENLARIMEVYRRTGRQMDMGSALFPTFRAAGLAPRLAGFTRIGDGAEAAGIHFFVESVRSLLPFMEKLGIAQAHEVDIDTLYDRLSKQIDAETCVFYPRLVGAWAKTTG